ncbi:MAG: Holliday junction resolvase RuvX [Alicyclobacillus sp.]|nr:Holliday junction resolvase RuvX [Alicyclobacillus sp.]
MKVLGVDYGGARIGLAVSDETGLLAHALTVLRRQSDEQAVAEVAAVIAREGVSEVVVGYPRNMDGSAGVQAQRSQAFARLLAERTGVPVVLRDERLTTLAAQRLLQDAQVFGKRRRAVEDAVAAAVLLQGYLDWKRAQAEKRG